MVTKSQAMSGITRFNDGKFFQYRNKDFARWYVQVLIALLQIVDIADIFAFVDFAQSIHYAMFFPRTFEILFHLKN